MANVNAHDAKKLRENLQASTFRIDLMGIGTMLKSSATKLHSYADYVAINYKQLWKVERSFRDVKSLL